ncbi:MAG: DUF2231 domain-containing protein [Roseiflexaceae bacterium]|jgi:uncharacterized membrane protein
MIDIILHPATVHVPIGAVVAAFLFAMWARYKQHVQLELSSFYLVIFAWITMIPSLISGTIDAVGHLNNPATPDEALNWINLHAFSAIALFVVMWRAWQIRRKITHTPVWDDDTYRNYAIMLTIAFVLVAISGWSGGYMVYELQLGRLS